MRRGARLVLVEGEGAAQRDSLRRAVRRCGGGRGGAIGVDAAGSRFAIAVAGRWVQGVSVGTMGDDAEELAQRLYAGLSRNWMRRG